jgi:Leucine-rich repeat (LRR) protein
MLHSTNAEEATNTKKKDLKPSTLDYSFHDLSDVQELLTLHNQEATRASSIRLSNNHLTNLKGFKEAFRMVLAPSEEVLWIDLSFNKLKSLDELVESYPNLRVLYLHGNKIEHLSQLDSLSHLKELRNLTIHGNPVVDEPNYRFFILSRLPKLKHLDFSAITKQDRISIRILLKRQELHRKNQSL